MCCEVHQLPQRQVQTDVTFTRRLATTIEREVYKTSSNREKKQIRLTQAKHTPSIEYDYATGNVDNIVERKQAITLEQIFEPLRGDSE